MPTTAAAPPLDWSTASRLDDAALPLFDAALLIARDEYPDLDLPALEADLAGHVRRLRRKARRSQPLLARLAALNDYLFEEWGLRGNHDEYDDPRNCYLNEVLERRLGIPISLAIVQLEIARRLGLPMEGVAFPGHYLVRLPVEDGIVVLDPYHGGRTIGPDELRSRAQPHFGGADVDDSQLLQALAPASHRTTLLRVLRNLKGMYRSQDDLLRVARCADRQLRLAPDLEEGLFDRGMAFVDLGHAQGAREDLARLLKLHPESDHAETARHTLVELGQAARLH
jgi:regulator of sirC expression with transglutaminase-like and TPR domain